MEWFWCHPYFDRFCNQISFSYILDFSRFPLNKTTCRLNHSTEQKQRYKITRSYIEIYSANPEVWTKRESDIGWHENWKVYWGICKVHGDWSVPVRLSAEGIFTFESNGQELNVNGMRIEGGWWRLKRNWSTFWMASTKLFWRALYISLKEASWKE
jgi:hypothetical protein